MCKKLAKSLCFTKKIFASFYCIYSCLIKSPFVRTYLRLEPAPPVSPVRPFLEPPAPPFTFVFMVSGTSDSAIKHTMPPPPPATSTIF